MSKDNQSLAPSEATTLADDDTKLQEERTTLTGKPIKYQHDHHSGMMLGDGGGFAAPGIGANLLPPGYTDKSRVSIPIKKSDFEDPAPADENEVKTDQSRKSGGLFSRFSSKRKEANDEIVVVMMSRGDYLKYWAKGADGGFADGVVEPPEGRKEWVRKQLEWNEEMKRQDPSLGKAGRGG